MIVNHPKGVSMNKHVAVVYIALAATVAILIAGFAAHAATPRPETVEGSVNAPRVCFPKKDWGPASDSIRPCVRITGVQEDGSFSYAVSDGNGTVRYTAGVGALDR